MRIACCLVLAGLVGWSPLARPEPPPKPAFLGQTRPAGRIARVVSLAPNLTEILFALGAGDRVVGVTRYDDYPKAVESIPKVGGFLDPSLEAIMGLRPDLVVCVPNSGNRKRMETLIRLHVPVFVLPAHSLADVYAAIFELGRLLHREERARLLVDDMRTRINAVAVRSRLRKKPKVLMVYGHNPLVVAGPGSFADELMSLAGAENVLSGEGVRYPSLPLEMVIKLSPEVIIDASSSATGASVGLAQVERFWGRLKVVPAVKTGRVHLFDSALWFRPGPRLAEGLERLEALLHPPSDGR